jgi:hypothetical protein
MVLCVLVGGAVLVFLPWCRWALASRATATRRVYRGICVEVVAIGVAAAVVATFAATVIATVLPVMEWTWTSQIPEGRVEEGGSVWLVLLVTVVFAGLGVILPGFQLANVALGAASRVAPTVRLRCRNVAGASMLLIAMDVQLSLAVALAVANNVMVTALMRHTLAGRPAWVSDRKSGGGVALGEAGVVVDWRSASIPGKFGTRSAMERAWGGLSVHGQRAVLAAAAAQCVLGWAIVAPSWGLWVWTVTM